MKIISRDLEVISTKFLEISEGIEKGVCKRDIIRFSIHEMLKKEDDITSIEIEPKEARKIAKAILLLTSEVE